MDPEDHQDQPLLQFVLPTSHGTQAMQACHDIGHLGINCMLNLLQDRFYWPDIQLDVEQHIKTCD